MAVRKGSRTADTVGSMTPEVIPMRSDSTPKRPNRSPESIAQRKEWRKQWRKDHRERENRKARERYDPAKAREYYRRWRESHPDYKRKPEHLRKEAEKQTRRVKWFIKNLDILRRTQGCLNCGKKTGRLEYHHVDPATKKYPIASMGMLPLERFVEELDKCVLLCRSCHSTLHVHLKQRDRRQGVSAAKEYERELLVAKVERYRKEHS